MKVDISDEIRFRTSRAGGKGGQNVNKVETKVEGIWDLRSSPRVDEAQRSLLAQRLQGHLNAEGALCLQSQKWRSQLANKEDVVDRMNRMVNRALEPKRSRIATKPTAASVERRIGEKRRHSERKRERGRRDEET